MPSETTGLRAITVRQPWASLIAREHKRYETRPYQPRCVEVGDLIAIHAGHSTDDMWRMGNPSFEAALRGADELLPLGAIVAIVRLGGVYPTTGAGSPSVVGDDLTFGDWRPGRWAWSLDVVRVLSEPVPCSGALGLWLVPDDVAERIAAAGGTEA